MTAGAGWDCSTRRYGARKAAECRWTLQRCASIAAALGASLNVEQQIAPDLGAFVRAGKAAGNVEAYEFTDIDRTLAAGLSLQGSRWHRTDDTVGLAAVNNGISGEREAYLNAGGLGILVGDGQLPHPGPEQIIESYYSAAVVEIRAPDLRLSMDQSSGLQPRPWAGVGDLRCDFTRNSNARLRTYARR